MLGNRKAQHSFAQTPSANSPRSTFDKSFAVKDTINFDLLYMIMCEETLPGDTFNVNLQNFTRMATQLVPMMDNTYLDFFFFHVPNRLVWENWERFMGAQDNPGDSTDYTVPQISVTNLTVADGFYEKMGIPLQAGTQLINALIPRCYNRIWNTWFRDENIQDSVPMHIDDGPDPMADYENLYRGKRHDYFTSCLPWPQKGAAVTIPLALTAPVNPLTAQTTTPTFFASNNGTLSTAMYTDNTFNMTTLVNPAGTIPLRWNAPGLQTDTSDLGGTINELRQAFQIQSLLELDATGGTRYTEILLAHFNVVSPDFRLQRPEYLGGGEIRINTHIVPQTSSTSGSNYLGNLASFATASATGNRVGFTKSFVEHGHVIGLVCARADISYQQGINKKHTRQTKYDYFWPKLQEIGEQTVLNREIYAKGDANDELVFGYQERYAEYKYTPSEIHGYFRSNASAPIDQWHMAQEFDALPELMSGFIEQSTPITRNLANTNLNQLLMDIFFDFKATRPMATYSTPAGLGRF